MKHFTIALAIMTITTASVSASSAFNVWDFISHPAPHEAIVHWDATTKEIAMANMRASMPHWIRTKVSDYWTIKLAKIALLNERPHANAATNALFLATIPAGESAEPELRYFAAFQRELALSYDGLLNEAFATIRPDRGMFTYQQGTTYNLIFWWVSDTHIRCDAIVDLMARLEGISSLASLAANPNFVRDSVRVTKIASERLRSSVLKPLTGVEITSSTNPLSLQVGATTQYLTYPAETALAMREFNRLGNIGTRYQVNQTSGATVVSKNGPNLVTVGATTTVLAKDASRVLTFAELGEGVKSVPIDLPVAARTLPDVTMTQGVVQSVNIDGLFTGLRVTTAVSSSDTEKVTVAKSRSGSTFGVTAVAVGAATVSVTGTNEAGAVSVTFDVTVTAAAPEE